MEKIKPILNFDDLKTLNVVERKQEYHNSFDRLMDAREELFDKKLSEGLDVHRKFLKECFTTR